MAGKRVLVVDDDARTVDLVKLYLNRDGYRALNDYLVHQLSVLQSNGGN